MANGDCGSEGLLQAQDTAVELYRLAALLLGGETGALSLVEDTLSQVEVDPCAERDQASVVARHQLTGAAVARLSAADPEGFVAPTDGAPISSCVEDEDLASAGISSQRLADLVDGAGRDQMRAWLERLPPAQRVIFVQRAVLGWDNGATAATLQQNAGTQWRPEQVSHLFRHALCSLTNSLVHARV
jgi:DNA-directed RNA polymerase specialized sigma24 family protein